MKLLDIELAKFNVREGQMQIGELFGQYNRSGQIGQAVPTERTSGAKNLAQALSNLTKGSVFEGNVSYLKGGNVILTLENGQNIHARLDGNIKLTPGQSLFFQVKSNEGGKIAIKPYLDGNFSNPTLTKALTAAGLPTDTRNLEMVDSMMKSKLSIDSESLIGMHRAIVANENVSVASIVDMTKLGIPVTPENAAAFENFKNDSKLLMSQMDDFISKVPEALANKDISVSEALKFSENIVEIFSEAGGVEEGELAEGLADKKLALGETSIEKGLPNNAETRGLEGNLDASKMQSNQVVDKNVNVQVGNLFSQDIGDDFVKPQHYASNQVGAFMDAETMEDFGAALKSIGDFAEDTRVFDEEGNLNKNLTSKQLLTLVNDKVTAFISELEEEDLKEVFSNKGFKQAIGNLVEEQWTLKPEDLKGEKALSKLYEKMERQLEDASKAAKTLGNEGNNLSQSVDNLKGSLDFMNQVNQVYHYVQIPLQMNDGKAAGDLYVYKNKKSGDADSDELTAFLHLDLDHLGSTDCFIKMKDKAVTTNFTIPDDVSYELVKANLPALREKLARMGYDCTVNVREASAGEEDEFVEDFIKKTNQGEGPVVHRYSFDVRA